jgi:hypothetical protein
MLNCPAKDMLSYNNWLKPLPLRAHPIGMQNHPSTADDGLLDWIAERRELYAMPGVMLIAGDNGLRIRTKLEGLTFEAAE